MLFDICLVSWLSSRSAMCALDSGNTLLLLLLLITYQSTKQLFISLLSIKKTAIHKVCDYFKGGTDMVDQRMKFYTSNTKAKSRHWTVTSFDYIQVAAFNKSLDC